MANFPFEPPSWKKDWPAKDTNFSRDEALQNIILSRSTNPNRHNQVKAFASGPGASGKGGVRAQNQERELSEGSQKLSSVSDELFLIGPPIAKSLRHFLG